MLFITAALLTVIPFGAAPAGASHQPASWVCEYFKPHTGDTTVWAIWDSGQVRYECAYHHPGSILVWNHSICAYPPEHYSPPDNVWTKQNDCP